MSVTVDTMTAGAFPQTASAVATLTTTTLISPGITATAIAFFLSFSNAAITSLVATWAGASLQVPTNCDRSSTNCRSILLGIVNPATGAGNSFVANWTGSSDFYVFAVSFIGTALTFANAFKNGANANDGGTPGTTASVSVNSASSDIAIAQHSSTVHSFSSTSASTVNTELYRAAPDNQSAAANYGTGAASVILSGTMGVADNWASVGCDIAAPGGAAGDTFGNSVSLIQMKRKSLGWIAPLGDPRRRVLRPDRKLWLPKNFKKAA